MSVFSTAILVQFERTLYLETERDFSENGNQLLGFFYALNDIAGEYGCAAHPLVAWVRDGYTGIEGVVIYHQDSLAPFYEPDAIKIRERVNALVEAQHV